MKASHFIFLSGACHSLLSSTTSSFSFNSARKIPRPRSSLAKDVRLLEHELSVFGSKRNSSVQRQLFGVDSPPSLVVRQSKVEVEPEDDGGGVEFKVAIRYCTGCRWMLRASWMAQELLTTFQDDLHGVSLVPSRPPEPGGTFLVTMNDRVIWDRIEEGRFPEAKELKQRIRDEIDPSRDLGHSDVGGSSSSTKAVQISGEKVVESSAVKTSSSTTVARKTLVVEEMRASFEDLDDDEAADLRRQFGVF